MKPCTVCGLSDTDTACRQIHRLSTFVCTKPSNMLYAGHKNAVLDVHWTNDGEKLLSASPDKTVRVWDTSTGQQTKKMTEHDNFVNSCSPLRRGPPLLCSGSDDGNVKVSYTPQCQKVLQEMHCMQYLSIMATKLNITFRCGTCGSSGLYRPSRGSIRSWL